MKMDKAKGYLQQAQKDSERTKDLPEQKRTRLQDESSWTKLQDSGYEFPKAST